MKVEIQADAGFALPAVYKWCETEGVGSTIGLMPNARLETSAKPLAALIERESEARVACGEHANVRLLAEAKYEAGGWGRSRRVVYKAEILE